MASKAKSGLSAVRQFPERVRLLTPPNTFVGGSTSFTGPINDGQGHSAIHVATSNNTAHTIKLLMAWRPTGPFVQVASQAAAVDPVTGLYTAEIQSSILRRFVKVLIDAPAPGLGVDFEVGAYFLPRADSPFLGSSGGNPPAPPAPAPGTVITTAPDTVVGIGATVPLPVPPAGTKRMTIQNTGPSGSVFRLRELGGVAGSGIKIVIFGQETYGGADGAIAPLEVEEVAGIATSVAIQFERT